MNTTLLRRVRRLFNSDMVPAHVNRRNQREYCRAQRVVGTNHLLAQPVQRKTPFVSLTRP